MKKAILAVLFFASTAYANQPARKAGEFLKKGAEAVKGGTAAAPVVGSAAVKMTAELTKIYQGIMVDTAPKQSDVDSFRAAMGKVEGIDGALIETLVKAFQTTVIDRGCLDADLSAEAYRNFAFVIEEAVNEHFAAHTTALGLANVAKHSDLNKDEKVDVDELKISNTANETLTNQALAMAKRYMTKFKVSFKQAVSSIRHLGARCGLKDLYPARLAAE